MFMLRKDSKKSKILIMDSEYTADKDEAHRGEHHPVLLQGQGLAEGEAGAVASVTLRVCQYRHEELGLMSVRSEHPAAGLTEQVQPMYEGGILLVTSREPLEDTAPAAIGVIVATYHEIVHQSGHCNSN